MVDIFQNNAFKQGEANRPPSPTFSPMANPKTAPLQQAQPAFAHQAPQQQPINPGGVPPFAHPQGVAQPQILPPGQFIQNPLQPAPILLANPALQTIPQPTNPESVKTAGGGLNDSFGPSDKTKGDESEAIACDLDEGKGVIKTTNQDKSNQKPKKKLSDTGSVSIPTSELNFMKNSEILAKKHNFPAAGLKKCTPEEMPPKESTRAKIVRKGIENLKKLGKENTIGPLKEVVKNLVEDKDKADE